MKLNLYYLFILIIAGFLFFMYTTVSVEFRFLLVATIYPLIVLIPIVTYSSTFLKVKISRDEVLTILLGLVWIAEIMYLIAEIIWCWYYNLLLGIEVPYPSEADIFYVSAALTYTAGIFLYLRTTFAVIRPKLTLRRKLAITFVSVIIATLVAMIYMYVISNWYPEIFPEEILALTLDVVYSMIDIIEIAFVVALILILGGRIGKIVALILVSALLEIAFDISFALLDIFGLYYDGHPIELLDLFSYLLDAVALYEARKIFR